MCTLCFFKIVIDFLSAYITFRYYDYVNVWLYFQDKLTIAQELKGEGNRLFKKQRYEEAIKKYTEAIKTCPDENKNEKSTYHQNKAAALEKLVSNFT